VLAQAAVADGVDAAVDAVQASRAHSPRDAALVHASRCELRDGRDPVLAIGDPRNLSIGGPVEFLSYIESKSIGPSGSPPRRLRKRLRS
jgi:hypothetical protein